MLQKTARSLVWRGMVIGGLLFSGSAAMAARTTFPSHGYVVDSTGTALSGDKSVTFSIYSAATGGTALWTETQTVTFTGGIYSTTLGATTAIPSTLTDANEELYLGVAIESDSEMEPRLQYTSTPWARLADHADTADALSSDAIAASAGAGLTNTDGVLSIAAGTGITVTDDGIALDTSDALVWTASQTYSGQVVAAANPASTASAAASFYINPTAAPANGKLIAIANNGTDKFTVDAEGDVAIAGALTVTGALNIAAGEIATADLADGAVTAAKILDGTIAAGDLAADAVTTAKILDGTIAAADLAADAVTSAKILDGTIATADIAADAVTAAKVLDGTLTTSDLSATAGLLATQLARTSTLAGNPAIAANLYDFATTGLIFEGATADTSEGLLTVTDPTADRTWTLPDASGTLLVTVTSTDITDATIASGDISTGGVTSTNILDGTIAAGDLAADSVTTAKITDGTIAAADIASDAVTTAKILDANVTTAKIADNAITTAKITDANVTLAKLAADSVSSAKIVDDSIVNADINSAAAIAYSKLALTNSIVAADITSNAVITAKINDGAVTSDKILDDTIATADIADLAVNTNKIALDTILAGDIATGAVATAEILDGTIVTDDIAAGGVGTADIADAAVTGDKINAAVAGAGLTGGGGSALAVTAGTGIAVSGDAVNLDLAVAPTWTGAHIFQSDVDLNLGLAENLTLTATTDESSVMSLNVTVADDAEADDEASAQFIDITNNSGDAGDSVGGIFIQANDAGTGVVDFGISIRNDQATDIDMTDGIIIAAATADSIEDGIDVSDVNLTNAMNVGANPIVGTTLALTASAALQLNIPDNTAAAAVIQEGGTPYMTFRTSNGTEYIQFAQVTNYVDGMGPTLGSDGDALLVYDEAGDDRVELTGAGASLYVEDKVALGRQTFTMVTGGAATENLTPTASYVEVTGQDDAADIAQIQTASAKEGDVLIVANIAATDVNIERTGTTKLDGGANVPLTQHDVMMLIFDGTNWLQVAKVAANS